MVHYTSKYKLGHGVGLFIIIYLMGTLCCHEALKTNFQFTNSKLTILRLQQIHLIYQQQNMYSKYFFNRPKSVMHTDPHHSLPKPGLYGILLSLNKIKHNLKKRILRLFCITAFDKNVRSPDFLSFSLTRWAWCFNCMQQ